MPRTVTETSTSAGRDAHTGRAGAGYGAPGSVGPYTGALAAFVAGLRYEDIPDAVVDRIQLLILDSLGCAIYAARLPWSRILADSLAAVDESQTSPIWGTDRRLSAPHAVLVNGTQVQGFELDDVHRRGVLHVGAVTLPPLFAVAGLRPGMSGRDMLTAAVAGYEVGPRVGLCMGQEHIAQGWHSGATVGVYAAAASAARGLGLDAARTVHALGIAGTQSAGLMAAQYGAMVKRMHAGRSAQSGFYGALLAERGFTGIQDVFENPYGGFCSTFSASTDKFDLSQLTAGLGTDFETMQISLKLYSCVGSNHTSLDAIRLLQAESPFGPDDVEAIVVHGSRVTVDHVGWPYHPEGMTAAQLNLPFCIATLLIEGEVFVEQFTDAAIGDPARIELSRRVEVVEDEEITARGSAHRHEVNVDVRLRDGRVLTRRVEAPRGSERYFASEDEVVAKFHGLSDGTLGPDRAARVRDLVLGLRDVRDVTGLLDALAINSPASLQEETPDD